MKVTINDDCTACGLCAETCPEVFTLEDDADKTDVICDEVPADAEDTCREAVDGCPVEAIEIVED